MKQAGMKTPHIPNPKRDPPPIELTEEGIGAGVRRVDLSGVQEVLQGEGAVGGRPQLVQFIVVQDQVLVFCWRPGKMRITPAMAAKVTDRFWTFADLVTELEKIEL
jgi:hypothetical protein